jgi:hypothetical protein
MREEMPPTTQIEVGPMWWGLFSSPWLFTLTSSSHNLLLLEKLAWQKDWVLLTSRMSLKLKNKGD